jgi:hypothetical protein
VTTAYSKTCFAAGTPIRTPLGHKLIEDLVPGDLLLSRDEFDEFADVGVQAVEEVFVRSASVWKLRLGGQVIRSTGEHPVFLAGRGWLCGPRRQWERHVHDLRVRLGRAAAAPGELRLERGGELAVRLHLRRPRPPHHADDA